MSTRARIEIVDLRTGETNRLFCGSDGYLSGIGHDLVRACDEIGRSPDLDSFSFKLLKGGYGLELDAFDADACVDWVYTIEWTPDVVSVFAQKDDWTCDVKRPISERLGERIDVRAYEKSSASEC